MRRFTTLAEKFKACYTGRYALVTNTVTAGAMGCAADAVAQFAEKKAAASNEKTQEWEWLRTRDMTIVSTVFGPFVYYWYRFLDNKYPGKTPKVLFRKVSLDLLIAPIWYGFYIGGLCLLKSHSFEEGMTEYMEKAPLLIAADLVIWPVLQTFNFVFFPHYYRIIGMKLNEIMMGVLTSHLVNNEYGISKIIAKSRGEK